MYPCLDTTALPFGNVSIYFFLNACYIISVYIVTSDLERLTHGVLKSDFLYMSSALALSSSVEFSFISIYL